MEYIADCQARGAVAGAVARPEINACLKSLRKGDTLVLWRLDRLGRILGDLIHLTNELKSRNVEFESLTEKGRPHERENKVAEVFAKTSLLQRKVGLENKAITGRLFSYFGDYKSG